MVRAAVTDRLRLEDEKFDASFWAVRAAWRRWRDGRSAFDATLNLKREEIGSASLAKALLAFPLITTQVTALIHWQALRLWWKGTPFYTHPKKSLARTEHIAKNV